MLRVFLAMAKWNTSTSEEMRSSMTGYQCTMRMSTAGHSSRAQWRFRRDFVSISYKGGFRPLGGTRP